MGREKEGSNNDRTECLPMLAAHSETQATENRSQNFLLKAGTNVYTDALYCPVGVPQ